MILVWINRRDHRWSSFYKMFAALALTDFLGVLLTYPFAIMRYISDFTYCFPIKICESISFVMVDAHLAAALLICALSFDRLLVLINPYHYRSRDLGRRYVVVIIAIWLFSSVFSMLQLVGVGKAELYFPGSWCYFDFVKPSIGSLFSAYFYSVVSFSIILITVVVNVFTMWKICHDPAAKGTLLDSSLVSGYYDSHVIVFIIAVTISFVATCTPLIVDIFLHALELRTENNDLEMWFERLTFLNAIIDPWLYIVLRKESIRRIILLYRALRNPVSPEEECLLER
ncbi:prostaglandin E2 receptor EP3 subtype-like [Saccostrea cucullata]|uniref:prostaglandin E2 receptor EP3 subtype-like n=1 Tax=Saccostrea cuccullata TaxID=36930 RepID=UPI002ED59FA5